MAKRQLVRFIMTTDTHGHWLDRPNSQEHSMLNLASTVKHLQSLDSDGTITIDLGDFIQGSSFATYLSQERQDGRVIARGMNTIGYDYHLIGNHEFNFGQDFRNGILEDLDGQLLLTNIINQDSGLPFMGQPYAIREFDGIKIGIIGSTTSHIPNWELPENYEGLGFVDAYEATAYYAKILRSQVDILVVAYHGGLERDLITGEPTEIIDGENQGYQMLTEIEGIDLLLTGHQHRLLNQQVKDTWVMQAGDVGNFVAEVCVELEEGVIARIYGDFHDTTEFSPDTQVAQAIEPEASEGRAWLNHVIGHAPIVSPTDQALEARVHGHPFLELLNQLQFDETGADFSAVTLVNDRFADFHGDITQEQLLKTYPFYNLIAKSQVTGQELYEIVEFNLEYFTLNPSGEITVTERYYYPKLRHYNFDIYSGFQTHVDLTQAPGQRVKVLIDERTGEPIDRNRTYTIAISQYRSVGGGEYHWFTPDKVLTLSGIDIATLLVDALQNYTEEEWQQINNNYQHLVWDPEFPVSDFQ